MNFGLFEPLFGKNPKLENNPHMAAPSAEIPSQPSPKTPDPVSAQPKKKRVHKPDTSKLQMSPQLGSLLGELDQSKVMVIILCAAVIILVAFLFYLNSRQKSQKKMLIAMNKQLKRLRG